MSQGSMIDYCNHSNPFVKSAAEDLLSNIDYATTLDHCLRILSREDWRTRVIKCTNTFMPPALEELTENWRAQTISGLWDVLIAGIIKAVGNMEDSWWIKTIKPGQDPLTRYLRLKRGLEGSWWAATAVQALESDDWRERLDRVGVPDPEAWREQVLATLKEELALRALQGEV